MTTLYKKFTLSVLLFLSCSLLLAACGGRETVSPTASAASGTEPPQSNVLLDENSFYDVAGENESYQFLAMQYHGGEPAQLWRSDYYEKDGERYADVYLFRKDGTKELCLKEVSRELVSHIAFADGQGCFYAVNGNSLTKLDASGRVLFSLSEDVFFRELCQLADGQVFALVLSQENRSVCRLARLEEGGSLTLLTTASPIDLFSHIGASEDGLLLLQGDYVYEIDRGDGTMKQALSLRQTSYAPEDVSFSSSSRPVRAFRMTGDGKLELLRADSAGSASCESLSFEAPDEDKIPVVLRSLSIQNDAWLKEQILKFNGQSEKYYVVIETPEEGEDRSAFITATGVQLATGKGADLLQGSNLLESVDSLLAKGGLEDLAPLMRESGISEEDYFPAAFALWREGDRIYSVCHKLKVTENLLDSRVLGGAEPPDVETVADAMLAYPEKAIYRSRWKAASVARELLSGSEALGGMADGAAGVCDLSGGLLAKVLEAAKRYQYDPKNNYPDISYSRYVDDYGFYFFETREETAAKGYTVSGPLFDDGCHPYVLTSNFALAVNANSPNREGAWEFLRFLLSEETQLTLYERSGSLPIHRGAFEAAAEKEMADWKPTVDNVAYEGPLTRERVDQMIAFVEDARALPLSAEAILDIICEEAQDYFNDVKSLEEVLPVIENRVNLYLQENK